MRLAALALGLLALLSQGCQGSAPPAPAASTRDLAALAADALSRGDYSRAAELYQNALADSPSVLTLHYGLGVATSHLDRREDTSRAFTWVVQNGSPESAEYRTAKRWLDGARAPADAFAASEPEDRGAARGATAAQPAMVHGRVTYGENPGDVSAQGRAQLVLYDHPNRGVYFRIRADEDGRFVFKNVPPGVYKLTDRVAGAPRWRLRLDIKAGQDLAIDLSPANSIRVRDDFPDAS